METRANYALIGAFVIVAALAALGFVLWLGQSQFNRDYDVYDAVFEGPVTLEEGASVRYIGIKVGEVTSIGIDRDDASKVRARFRVDNETPVKTDSTATIEFAGITGVTFIQINAGSPNAQWLKRASDANVPEIETISNPLSALVSSGAEVMGRATLALERIDELLSQENIDAVSSSVQNVEAITAALSGNGELFTDVNDLLASANSAALSFNQASQDLGQLGRDASVEVKRIGDEISEITTGLEDVTASARSAIERVESAVDSAASVIEGPGTDAVVDFRLIAQDMRTLISRLDRLTREIEQNPQGLLRNEPLPYERDGE
ncbi:MlaD family protein [Henriciella marina]|uniref:MlaD family protein n=1 Tax=Henriciella marina TaxID=453851 RepID=UPI00035F2B49|nr:MlaD family protein [Henriciella marina]